MRHLTHPGSHLQTGCGGSAPRCAAHPAELGLPHGVNCGGTLLPAWICVANPSRRHRAGYSEIALHFAAPPRTCHPCSAAQNLLIYIRQRSYSYGRARQMFGSRWAQSAAPPRLEGFHLLVLEHRYAGTRRPCGAELPRWRHLARGPFAPTDEAIAQEMPDGSEKDLPCQRLRNLPTKDPDRPPVAVRARRRLASATALKAAMTTWRRTAGCWCARQS
eukprot:scaffold123484_cov28-Tisochrysis_lutea.AAC.2